MAYRLNEDNSVLYEGDIPVLKAANDIGKNILIELVNFAKNSSYPVNVLSLSFNQKQKVWFNVKGKYILFDLSEDKEGFKLVRSYLEKYKTNEKPDKNTTVANLSGGALATDGGIAIATSTEKIVDVEKASDVVRKKLDKNK